jgi:hypothetical protein
MKIKASWRTSVFGAGGLVAVIAATATALTDGKPETSPDWGAVVGALMACAGLFFARDDKVSSEQAGAGIIKPEDLPHVPPKYNFLLPGKCFHPLLGVQDA